jgi:hypothetical protein
MCLHSRDISKETRYRVGSGTDNRIETGGHPRAQFCRGMAETAGCRAGATITELSDLVVNKVTSTPVPFD